MNRPAVRAGSLLAVLVGIAVAALTVDLPDVPVLRAWVLSVGPLAPLVFTIGYAVSVPLPVPKSVLTALAGVAFGVWPGIPLVVMGATTGATLSFGLARVLGQDAVNRMAAGRLDRVHSVVERHGALAALLVRLIPGLPFTVLNYACGVTTMRLRHYVLGTALSLAPSQTIMVILASTGARVSFWMPMMFTASLALIPLGAALLRRVNHNQSQ